MKTQKTKTDGKTSQDRAKQYYKVYSIEELESMIRVIKRNRYSSEENIKDKCAIIVLRFEEHKDHVGQLIEVRK